MNAKKKGKVLVGICSACQYKARREAVRETWLAEKVEGIEARFFLGQPPAVHRLFANPIVS